VRDRQLHNGVAEQSVGVVLLALEGAITVPHAIPSSSVSCGNDVLSLQRAFGQEREKPVTLGHLVGRVADAVHPDAHPHQEGTEGGRVRADVDVHARRSTSFACARKMTSNVMKSCFRCGSIDFSNKNSGLR